MNRHDKRKRRILEEIFNDDPDGILDVKPKSQAKGADQRLIENFEEINSFYREKGNVPEPNASNINEYKLYTRLKGLRENVDNIEALKAYDEFNLLEIKKKEFSSIDDILGDDDFDILGDEGTGLYAFKHTPKETNMPDYIASRNKCEDFEMFDPLLKQCQRDLKDGSRKLTPFKQEQQIHKGNFFVLKGVLLFVASVGKRSVDESGKSNARLRCIFENGTESDLLLRSLAAELYKDGKRVTEHLENYLDGLKGVSEDDNQSGFIYVLKSLSKDPKLQSIKNLHKIGYSTTDVEVRIANAVDEPTYLYAPVEIVASWKCYNMNPQKLEQNIHNFFSAVCLDIDLYDIDKNRFRPREWFVVPFNVIEETINLTLNGNLSDFQYDMHNHRVILKQ